MRLTLVGVILFLTGCSRGSTIPQFFPALQFPTQVQPVTPAQTATTAQMEKQVIQQINAIRKRQGLVELRHNEKLAGVARKYSSRMAKQNFFAHVGPQGDTLTDRVSDAGIFYILVGENLFSCTNIPQPVPAAINGWMKSPGHRENLLRPEYRETGVGVWQQKNKYYFTQLFMRSLF